MRIQNQSFINTVIKRDQNLGLQITKLLKEEDNHYRILLYLIDNGVMTPTEAYKLWADSLGIAWLDMHATLFQQDIIQQVPQDFAKTNAVMPVYQFGERVTVAMADPTSQPVIARLEQFLKVKISPVFAPLEDILATIEVQYQTNEQLDSLSTQLNFPITLRGAELSKADLEKRAGDASIVTFTDSLLLLAVKDNASDIHIEPFEHNVRIRFRIDGLLIEKTRLGKDLHPVLLSRLKIVARLDITEKRKPQDGRISLDLGNHSIGFRLSTVPTVYGEKAVLRLLGQIKKRNIPQLEELNFSRAIFNWASRLIESPNGAFFITGPTGSGKTTTLFSALQRINTPEKNIMTIEDPVEYRLPGINQVQVNHAIGLNFASVLRSFLRQDPDVILIGEIRDLETAKIATEAALTGHLVFATLHTNDALQAVTRLVEIGVEPFLVGPSLIGVMAQRLVRKVCQSCKESYIPDKEQMDELFLWDGKKEVPFFRGKGCPKCRNTGFNGRLSIHELVIVDENLRKLVSANAPINEMRQAAHAGGYQTMRYDALKKVLRGLTTIDEVNRVIPAA